jgi:hypothetical protein
MQLTECQATTEWFHLRMFTITSTVSEKVLRIMLKHHSNSIIDEDKILFDAIGMKMLEHQETISEEYLKHVSYSETDLMKLSAEKLRSIAKGLNRLSSGNKLTLVTQIKLGAKEQHTDKGSLMDTIIKGWFMKNYTSSI